MCSSPATGRQRGCRQPSRARFAPGKRRRKLQSRLCKMNDVSTLPDDMAALDDAVTRATRALLALQREDGHFLFELEADATIPAEYVLLVHYLGEAPNVALEQK